MADNPNYIQLTDRLQGTSLADVRSGSGFTLSGREVKEFPKDPDAIRFVRRQMALGNIEVAGRAEFQEYKESREEFADANGDPAKIPFQEAAVKRAARDVRRAGDQKRAKRRADKSDDEASADANNDTGADGKPLEEMNTNELKAQAEALGVATSGNKEALLERVRGARSKSQTLS